VRRLEGLNGSVQRSAPPKDGGSKSIPVLVGSSLCDLEVWTEEEWVALASHERPLTWVHVEGLGWVGVRPIVQLN